MLRITLDTNAVNLAELSRIEAACAGRKIDVAHTSVTDREQEGTTFSGVRGAVIETGVWDESRWGQFFWGGRIHETLVIGESRLGSAALGSDESRTRFEAILDVIGHGSFPRAGQRDGLTAAQRRQLRDAMILEAHARERRDVFVTNDVKSFIRHGRWERLEALCATRIMTVDEFLVWLADSEPAATPEG
jgi:hypothetical protein